MYCQKCEKENPGNICENCGAVLDAAASKTQPTSPNIQPTSPNPSPKKEKKPIVKKWWFWLIIVLVGIIFINLISGGKNDNNDGNNKNNGSGTETISVDSVNTIENVMEYEINRVFVAEKLEAFIDGSLSYTPSEGNQYIVVDVNLKNLTSQYSDISNLIKMTLDISGTSYIAQDYGVTNTSINSYSGIEALGESRVYFAAQVPIGTTTENMILTVDCGGKKATTNISVSQFELKKANITFGQEYTDNETLSITFQQTSFSERIEPANTSGVYSYYEAEGGKTYLVVKFTVKNLKGSALDIDNITAIKAIYDGKYKYNGFTCIETDNGSDLDSYGEINPLESTTGYHLIEVPREVENGPVELEIYVLGQVYYYTVK